MGIRIQKCIGYGLTDLKLQGYEIVDDRIDPNGAMIRRYEETKDFSLEAYDAWLRERHNPKDNSFRSWDMAWEIREIREMKNKQKHCYEPDRCIISDTEFGIPSVMCIIPLTMRGKWCRYDDDIDYAEDHYARINQEHSYFPSRVLTMQSGFYPWENMFWDKRTRREIEGHIPSSFLRHDNEQRKKKEDWVDNLNFLAKEMGFESMEDAQTNMRPMPPHPVQILCEFLKIFKDPASFSDLVPIIYTYWS